ncbi:hypothetical protein D3C86_1824250 [compost metagenome]
MHVEAEVERTDALAVLPHARVDVRRVGGRRGRGEQGLIADHRPELQGERLIDGTVVPRLVDRRGRGGAPRHQAQGERGGGKGDEGFGRIQVL